MYSSFDEILKEIASIEKGTIKTKKEMKEKIYLIHDTLGVLSQRFYFRECVTEDRSNILGEDITYIDGVVEKMIGGVSIEIFFGTVEFIKMKEQVNAAQTIIIHLIFSKKIKFPLRNRFLS